MLLAMLFLLAAPLAGVSLAPERLPPGLGVLALLAVAVTGLGFWLAWVMDSTAGYHGIMMLFLSRCCCCLEPSSRWRQHTRC
jgi:ABC-2 type transport system permease protein